ncbi:metallothionein family protein [Pseudomonas yamanorum]|uniref:metallothionein family protein n=1 Tax=Pseudomonas yamanorum TaxID=515393 RepID=UPI003D35A7E2
MSNTATTGPCACTACTCDAADFEPYQRDGKIYCSPACADLHLQGKPCPAASCQCKLGVKVQERAISDSQLDEAIEETFPASDPISP